MPRCCSEGGNARPSERGQPHCPTSSTVGYPFSSLWWYCWQNDPLLPDTSWKPDERECDEGEEGFGGIRGKILLCSCTGRFDYMSCLLCSSQILFNSVFSADTCWLLVEGYCAPYTKLSCLNGFHNLKSCYYLYLSHGMTSLLEPVFNLQV